MSLCGSVAFGQEKKRLENGLCICVSSAVCAGRFIATAGKRNCHSVTPFTIGSDEESIMVIGILTIWGMGIGATRPLKT